MCPLPFQVPTAEEIALARSYGLLAGGVTAFGVFGLPAVVGIVVESAQGAPLNDMPTALAFVLASIGVCTFLGRVWGERALRRSGPAAWEEAETWVSLTPGEVLQAACPASLIDSNGAVPGSLVITNLQLRFLAEEGSRRRIAHLGPRDQLELALEPDRGARWWRTPPPFELVFRNPSPRAYSVDAGLRSEHLQSWLSQSTESARIPSAMGAVAPGQPAWEERARTAQTLSDLRLVARPLRCAAARGAIVALIAAPFANGALFAIGVGCLVATLAGLEHLLSAAQRSTRYLAAIGASLLSAAVLLGLVAQAHVPPTGAPSMEAYASGLNEALLRVNGPSQDWLMLVALAGIALACGLATAWRLRVPLAGLILLASAGAGVPLVLDPGFGSMASLTLVIGVKLAVMLVLVAAVVDVSDTWLLARRELTPPPTWNEVFADTIHDRLGRFASNQEAPSTPR